MSDDYYGENKAGVIAELITVAILSLVGIMMFVLAEMAKADDTDTFLSNETIQIDQDGPDQDKVYDEDDQMYDEMDDYEDKEDECNG